VTLPGGFEGLERFRAPSSILEGDGKPPDPTEAELERALVAPGGDALLPAGIVYQAGYEQAGDGLARHARAQARALARAGVAVSLQSLPTSRMMLEDEIEESVRREVQHLRMTSVGSAPIAIRQIILHSHRYLENVVAPAGARLADFDNEMKVYRSTVVYTSWERSTVHPEVVEILNRCGRVWVPCNMNYNVFRNAGVRNVDVIPCPFDPETSLTAGVAAPRGKETAPSGKRFYAIGKWEPRKNYHALIGAFLSAFTMEDRASLFLKTHEWGAWKDYPSIGESVEHWLSDFLVRDNGWTRDNYGKRLRVVTKKLPDEKILAIHRDNNIYVTCSHGEAWDLPAFDARVAGNRLVYTGWGGAEDYAAAEDIRILVEHGKVCEPVHPGYGWESGAEWARCPVADIMHALVEAEPPARRMLPPDLYRDFGSHAVGRRMLMSLNNVSAGTVEDLLVQGGFG
jgi:glycosyltransferase involved in cell wall biosynthesis